MRIALLAMILALAAPAAAQYAIPNDACEGIVEAFRQGDFALLIPVLFDLDDDAAFDSLFRAQADLDEADYTEYSVSRSDVAKDYERNLMSLQQRFHSALEVADSLGVDWTTAQYAGFTVNSEERWLGYSIYHEFEIALTQGDQVFWLRPGILRETPDGWKLAAGQGCRFCWR